jgi:hypothetical protein
MAKVNNIWDRDTEYGWRHPSIFLDARGANANTTHPICMIFADA